jgi:hypothetical protein
VRKDTFRKLKLHNILSYLITTKIVCKYETQYLAQSERGECAYYKVKCNCKGFKSYFRKMLNTLLDCKETKCGGRNVM